MPVIILFLLLGRENLRSLCPSLRVLIINSGAKGYSEVHSAPFTKGQLLSYDRMASDLDGDVLLKKAYSEFGIAYSRVER